MKVWVLQSMGSSVKRVYLDEARAKQDEEISDEVSRGSECEAWELKEFEITGPVPPSAESLADILKMPGVAFYPTPEVRNPPGVLLSERAARDQAEAEDMFREVDEPPRPTVQPEVHVTDAMLDAAEREFMLLHAHGIRRAIRAAVSTAIGLANRQLRTPCEDDLDPSHPEYCETCGGRADPKFHNARDLANHHGAPVFEAARDAIIRRRAERVLNAGMEVHYATNGVATAESPLVRASYQPLWPGCRYVTCPSPSECRGACLHPASK